MEQKHARHILQHRKHDGWEDAEVTGDLGNKLIATSSGTISQTIMQKFICLRISITGWIKRSLKQIYGEIVTGLAVRKATALHTQNSTEEIRIL